MVTGLRRSVGAMALAVAAVVALALPLTSASDADAAGSRYDVSSWKDPDGVLHRIRWNPCQTVTYAVNPRLAGATAKARSSAVSDVREAFGQVSRQTGITFAFAGRTEEIPRNRDGEKWSSRQRAAEIVVAWIDQDRTAKASNLMTRSGGRYPSGVGGWMMRTWTGSNGWSGAIGRGYVVINADHNRLYRRGFGSGMTRGALLLHEIGHAVGLGHAGATSELMYPTMLDRKRSAYRSGDREGLAKVGSGLGCIAGAGTAWPQI